MTSESQILSLLGDVPANADHLPQLIDQLHTRSGILPFIGAGMSYPFQFPLWGNFLLDLAKEAGLTASIQGRLDSNEYEEAAGDLMAALEVRRFNDRLASAYGDGRLEGLALTGAIAELPKLPPGPMVTTNFDRVVETVFQQAGQRIEPYWHSQVSKGSEALQQDKPFLLKLHGDWSDSSTRILTLKEYESAYGDTSGNKIDLNRPIPNLLFRLVSSRCCLFLGCSLKQDRTMAVLRAVAGDIPDLVHYALVERPKDDSAFRARAAELSALGIRPIWFPTRGHAVIRDVLAFLAERAATQRPAPAAASGGKSSAVNNIPNLGNRTVGREGEVNELSNMLRSARLITITGPGGSGKSRLAIELAHARAADFEDGVLFVPLADLDEKAGAERLLVVRIANIARVTEQPGRPPNEALIQHLAARHCLLILDNCEHLYAAAAEICGELLENCPDVTIVATSRRPLKLSPELRYERLYPLGPLAVPEEDCTDAALIAETESVRLFLERVSETLPNYAPDEAHLLAIGKLCRALDGIPLAIEVAVARLGVKSVEEMHRESENLLVSLGDAGVGDLRRWNTLTAALRWSYRQLAPAEQLFMRCLAVFDGGWTLEAAAAASGCDDTPSAVPHLQSLIDNSLVTVQEQDGARRFRFLEPIRQFAREESSGEERAESARRHAAYFLDLAERAAPEFLGANQTFWLDRLHADADNLRAAMRWGIGAGDVRHSLRIAAALWRFTEIRGHLGEGRSRAATVLEMPGADDFPELKSKVLSGAGMLAYRQADFDEAERLFKANLELEEAAGRQAGIANALNDLGIVARMRADFTRALDLFERALELERKSGNRRQIAVLANNIGSILFALGENERAFTHLTESYRVFREMQNDRDSAFPLHLLAQLSLDEGDPEAALEYAGKSLAIREKARDNKGIADTIRTVGLIEIARGRFSSAKKHLGRSINLALGLNDRRGVAESLDAYAGFHAASKRPRRTVELLAAADQIRLEIHLGLAPAQVKRRDALLAAAKQELGELHYSRAWRRGASLGLNDAVEAATADGAAAGAG